MATVAGCSAPQGYGIEMILAAGAFWFAVMFSIGVLLGPVRMVLLEPQLGPLGAVLVEALPMLVAMTLLAPWAARLFGVPATIRARLAMGASGLILLIVAETILGALLRGQGPGFWLTRAGTAEGWVYFALLGAFALMPLLRRRG